MGLLDKLKPQPRWKHADPPFASRPFASSTTRSNWRCSPRPTRTPGSGGRRSPRSPTPAVLGRVAAGDADAETRDRAADRLLALATAPARTRRRRSRPSRALTDPRRLSTIAKSDAPRPVRAEALARTDRRARARQRRAARQARGDAPRGARAADRRRRARRRRAATASTRTSRWRRSSASSRASTGSRAAARRSRRARSRRPSSKRARAHRFRRSKPPKPRAAPPKKNAAAARPSLLRSRRAARRRRRRRPRRAPSSRGCPTPGSALERRPTPASRSLRARRRAPREARSRAASAKPRKPPSARASAPKPSRPATRSACASRRSTATTSLEQLVPIEEEWRSLLPLVGNGPEADRLAERFAQAVAACRKRHEMGAVLAETRATARGARRGSRGVCRRRTTRPRPPPLAGAQPRGTRPRRRARRRRAGRPTTSPRGSRPSSAAFAGARRRAPRGASRKAQQDVVGAAAAAGRARATRVAEAETITLREGDRLMRDIGAGLDDVGTRRRRRARSTRRADRLRALQEKVAPRVRELREMDDWRRFANAQRQEQLIAMAEAIVASLKSDEEAGKDVGPRRDGARAARAARQVAGSRRSAAPVRAAAVGSLPHRHRLHPQPLRGVLREAARRARRQPAEEGRARRGSRSARRRRPTGARPPARFQELQTEWQAARAGAARRRPRARAAVPHRVQRVLRAPPRGSDRPQEGVDRQPREEGSAVRARRGAGRIDRLGRRLRRDEAAAGRVEDRSARCAATSPKSCGIASAPPPTSSSSATTTVIRSRSPASSPSAKRWSSSSKALAAAERRRAGRSRRRACSSCARRGTAACRFRRPR